MVAHAVDRRGGINGCRFLNGRAMDVNGKESSPPALFPSRERKRVCLGVERIRVDGYHAVLGNRIARASQSFASQIEPSLDIFPEDTSPSLG